MSGKILLCKNCETGLKKEITLGVTAIAQELHAFSNDREIPTMAESRTYLPIALCSRSKDGKCLSLMYKNQKF
ncbi:MAG: hypothetical protein MJZ95_00225 [Paludibacteraceae bacterium]|nr:hypothetical protein [Paludibacteraceae bacterium]